MPFRPRDPRREKIQIEDPGSEMNIPNFIFESLVLVFWVKDTVLKSGIRDLVNRGSGKEKFRSGTRDLMFNSGLFLPGSATLAVPTGKLFSTQSEVPSLITVPGTWYLSTAVYRCGTQYKCLQYIRWYIVKPTLYKLPITLGVFTLYGSVLYIIQYRTELEHAGYIPVHMLVCKVPVHTVRYLPV
jgi:hypothetical protein